MIKLTTKKILEFYDVPQLFVATDALGIDYLCVLYTDSVDGYEYLGVQVSELRLNSFLAGDFDLRKAYTCPERDNSLYHITVKDKEIIADKLLLPEDITEEMLPEAGFYFDAQDSIDDTSMDTVQIDIPVEDRNFFADIAKRMGWSAKLLHEASRKIAVL